MPWFLAQAEMPGEVSVGYRGVSDSGPKWSTLSASDGSWAWARIQAGKSGVREVRQGGPKRLWNHVETAYKAWKSLGRPDWDRLELTVTGDGVHRVWLDEPGGVHEWVLPQRSGSTNQCELLEVSRLVVLQAGAARRPPARSGDGAR